VIFAALVLPVADATDVADGCVVGAWLDAPVGEEVAPPHPPIRIAATLARAIVLRQGWRRLPFTC